MGEAHSLPVGRASEQSAVGTRGAGRGGRTRLPGQAERGHTGLGGPDLGFILSAAGTEAALGHDQIVPN